MTLAASRRLAATLALAGVLATPAIAADDPGPGGTRPILPKNGEEVYRMVCQACHMADAKGGVGAATIPALAGNERLGAPEYPLYVVLNGKGAMPWFKDSLTPQQVAEVVGYVRTHFGNDYKEPVAAADAEAILKAGRGD